MAPGPADAFQLFFLLAVLGGAASVAVGIAVGKARVASDVRRHGGRVSSIRFAWTPFFLWTRRAGFHVDLVDAQGRLRRARAYPYWGKVFWRQGTEAFSVAQAAAGTVLDREWWTTPYSGPPGPLPERWLPADSPPTVRRNRMWFLPVGFGAFFAFSSLMMLPGTLWLAGTARGWLFLALPVLGLLIGAGLIAFGLVLRRR